MTNPDFAELRDKLCLYDLKEVMNSKELIKSCHEDDFLDGVMYQNTKSAAIITELLEIIQSQSEVIKEFYKTAQRIDKFGYGVNIESKGIISNTEEILVNTCANAIEVITETNTRLQKLRDGK